MAELGFVPSVGLLALHIPPDLVAALTIQNAFARYGHVDATVGIDQRMEVLAVETLPTCNYGLGIEVVVGGKEEFSPLADVEVDVAAQCYGTCGPVASGNQNHAAARCAARVDGGTYGSHICFGIGIGTSLSAKVDDVECVCAEGRHNHAVYHALSSLKSQGHGVWSWL